VTRGLPSEPRMAATAVGLAAAAAAATQVSANDLWWHLKTGEWIAVHGAIPRADPFSFTSAGAAWVDHGWLWQISAWSLHALAGLSGVVGLKLACAVVVAMAAHLALSRSRWGPIRASLLVLLCVAGLRFRLTDRPETASLALLSIFLLLLIARGIRPGRRIFLGFLLSAVWSNVHAGVLLAPALAGACAAGSLIETSRALRERSPAARDLLARARCEAGVAIASFAGLLVNPYGYRLLLVPLRLSGALADPRLVNPEWLRPRAETFPLFYAVLVSALLLCAHGILRRADASLWRPMILIGGAGALAMSGARHIGIFFTVLPFAAAAWREREVGAEPAGIPPAGPPSIRLRVRAAIPGLAAAALFPFLPASPGSPPGLGVEKGRFPSAEADYVVQHLKPPRRLYNDVGHGGYLIWRLYPEDRVFIDGRNEVHAALLHEIAAALDDGRAWAALLDRYGIGSAIVRYREEPIRVAGTAPDDPGRSFSALHFPRTKWALVFWGDAAMVFVRRGGAYDALIERDEYQYADPEDYRYLERRSGGDDRRLLAGILSDLERRIASGPPSERAAMLQERFRAIARR